MATPIAAAKTTADSRIAKSCRPFVFQSYLLRNTRFYSYFTIPLRIRKDKVPFSDTLSSDQTEAKWLFLREYAPLASSCPGILALFNDTLGQINQASGQVSSGASQIFDSSQALVQGATEQASSVEKPTASILEISAQVRQNSAHATNASEKHSGQAPTVKELVGKFKLNKRVL